MKKINISQIVLALLTIIIGAIFIVFLSEEIENITNKIIITLCGTFLITMIAVNLICNLEE